jgi:hypothetical protein
MLRHDTATGDVMSILAFFSLRRRCDGLHMAPTHSMQSKLGVTAQQASRGSVKYEDSTTGWSTLQGLPTSGRGSATLFGKPLRCLDVHLQGCRSSLTKLGAGSCILVCWGG